MKFQGHVSISSETEIVVEHIQRELIGHQGLIADLGVRHRIRRNFYVPSETMVKNKNYTTHLTW